MRRLPLSLPLLFVLAPAALAGVQVQPRDDAYEVTFRYQPVIAVQQVCLAGSFNGWDPKAQPMDDRDGDGVWLLTLTLPKGRHHYKFVINGDQWQHDNENPLTDPDGMDGYNSVLELGAGGLQGEGRAGDGEIDADALLHDTGDLSHVSAVDGRRRLVLRLYTRRNDLEAVTVKASPRPREGEAVAQRIATVDGRDVYEARLSWSRAPRSVKYAFQLQDGETTAQLPAGRKRFVVSSAQAGRFETPDWVRDAVFYQIFPDRFRDGSAEAKPYPPGRPEGRPWNIDDRFSEAWDAKPAHHNFMGGDLDGITEKLDYLRELGVTALYLNPIFAAESNHRYDASDFETIDPALGTLEDFHELRDASRARDLRIVLDCVFNHTGDEHYAFQDAMQKGPESRYWDWYFFEGGFPVSQNPPNYKCWWGFGDLPQLNTANPEVIQHLMKAGTKWLKEGAHGWRLDVPNEVDAINPGFWPEFRRRVKKHDPETYIVGEIWNDARQWLQGDKFDAVMNYPVRSAALQFLVKGEIDAGQFRANLSHQLATYPEPALQVQFNLLGSHDTARIRTIAGGDLRRVRAAQTFVFAWPGAPVIYYGDEIGLEGGKDPDCRRTYPWERPQLQDTTTLEHVKRLGELRAAEPALRRGVVRFLASEGRLAAFARVPETGAEGRVVVCVLNGSGVSSQASVPLGELQGAPSVLVGASAAAVDDGRLELELEPYGVALIALD